MDIIPMMERGVSRRSSELLLFMRVDAMRLAKDAENSLPTIAAISAKPTAQCKALSLPMCGIAYCRYLPHPLGECWRSRTAVSWTVDLVGEVMEAWMPTVAIKIHGTLKMGCMIWYMFNFKCVRPGERIHRWESHVYQSGVTDCDAACLSSVEIGRAHV